MSCNAIKKLPVIRYTPYLLFSLLGGYSVSSCAGPLVFDESRLKNRGLDAGLSQYFSQAQRFSPGEYPVTWIINGRKKGLLMTRFDAQGTPCFSPDIVRELGIVSEFNQGCMDYQADYPAAKLTSAPDQNQIDLFIPASALKPERDLLPVDTIKGGGGGYAQL